MMSINKQWGFPTKNGLGRARRNIVGRGENILRSHANILGRHANILGRHADILGNGGDISRKFGDVSRRGLTGVVMGARGRRIGYGNVLNINY
jgi:hypothetical protein